jgi:hypothetical protein
MTTPHPLKVRIMLMWNWDRFPEDDPGFMARQPYRLMRFASSNEDREWEMMDRLYWRSPRVSYSSEGLGKRKHSRNANMHRHMHHGGKTVQQWDEVGPTVKEWLESR